MSFAAEEIVQLRDGRQVFVTDLASSDPDDYKVYSIDAYEQDGSFVVKDELPVESIFVGRLIATNAVEAKAGEKYVFEKTGKVIYLLDWITSDISEVVSS